MFINRFINPIFNMRICVGGTFDRFHKGHKTLIKKAFEVIGESGTVFIGLAKGDLVRNKKNIRPFHMRKRELKKFLINKGFNNQAVIVPITNKYGLTLDEDFDAIVISPETEKIAIQINKKRILKGKKPLKIIKIPYILAEDDKPISSTRVKNKEIDENGNIFKRH